MKKIQGVVLVSTLLAAGAQADEDLKPSEMLSIAKVTGLCGAMQQLVAFQSATKMPGGDEFVVRFYKTELARLGTNQEAFTAQCVSVTNTYNAYMAHFESRGE